MLGDGCFGMLGYGCFDMMGDGCFDMLGYGCFDMLGDGCFEGRTQARSQGGMGLGVGATTPTNFYNYIFVDHVKCYNIF